MITIIPLGKRHVAFDRKRYDMKEDLTLALLPFLATRLFKASLYGGAEFGAETICFLYSRASCFAIREARRRRFPIRDDERYAVRDEKCA